MSERRKLIKTINGVKTKYDNDYCVIYFDSEWNEYIVKDKSLPKYDDDGVEFGCFTSDIQDAIDTFNYQTKCHERIAKKRAEFAHAFCNHLNTSDFK